MNSDNSEPLATASENVAPLPNAVVKPITKRKTLPTRDEPVQLKDFMEYVEVKKTGYPDHDLKKDYEVRMIKRYDPLVIVTGFTCEEN